MRAGTLQFALQRRSIGGEAFGELGNQTTVHNDMFMRTLPATQAYEQHSYHSPAFRPRR